MINEKQYWIKKLALGTVQFGLNYGISNKTGQVQPETIAEILEHAQQVGLNTLDTASTYGNCEEVLGLVLRKQPSRFNIISKFPVETSPEALFSSLESSLSKLTPQPLKAYLAHEFESFKQEGIRVKLQTAKELGLVEQIGVSVYYPEEIEWLLEKNISFDIIQCPFNLFDQRFKFLFSELKNQGVEIHTRSSFLQGLFFLNPKDLSNHFEKARGKIQDLQLISQGRGIPLAALLLNFCIMQEEIDKVVFGVQNLNEFIQNLAAYHYFETCKELRHEFDVFATTDEDIIHPGKWP